MSVRIKTPCVVDGFNAVRDGDGSVVADCRTHNAAIEVARALNQSALTKAERRLVAVVMRRFKAGAALASHEVADACEKLEAERAKKGKR